MLFELIFLGIIGIICIIHGWLIWKKQQIQLIHSYHYAKVAEENKKPYTALMGKGMVVLGVGTVLTGIINFITRTGWGWLIFAVCFAIGIGLMICAGKKYNR